MIPHSRPALGPEEKRAVETVLDSGEIAQGEKVATFEKGFCEFTGRRYGVAVSSGTAALQLSLLALGIGRGDEVILPSFTCVALLHALDSVGARPVLTDIDLHDFNLSLSEVKKKIRRKTKAILVPHAFGAIAQVEALEELGFPLIEDGTQSLGAQIGTKKVGSFGVVSLFSFYATKMITTGEGGMALTNQRRIAEKLLDMRSYDKKPAYSFRTNSKMTDMEAAMGIEQLKKLPIFIERRREIARRYTEALKGWEGILPESERGREHVFYRYVVRVPKRRKEWMRELQAQGIDAKEPVFKPLHQYLRLKDSLFPATALAMREACSLPIYPALSLEACERICQLIQERPMPSLATPAPVLNL